MDDLNAPITTPYTEERRLPLITLPEAQDAVRLLMLLADDAATDDDRADAYHLAHHLAERVPAEG